jgi:predicted O-linked N-acetylglucosamine transferase (SPINDLY family)
MSELRRQRMPSDKAFPPARKRAGKRPSPARAKIREFHSAVNEIFVPLPLNARSRRERGRRMSQSRSNPEPTLEAQLEAASFADLLNIVEQIGPSQGHRQVIDLYRTWIAMQAGGRHLHAAWFNLGAEWTRAGDSDSAIASYRSALALRPDFTPAAINLGLLLEQRDEARTALAVWGTALQSDDARKALINQRARVMENLGDLAEAEAAMRASLLIQPDQTELIQHWLRLRQRMCLWPVLNDALPGLCADELMASCGPLAALALTDQVAVLDRVAANWINHNVRPAPAHLAPPGGYRHDRIRLGYLSADFRDHAMSDAIAELFERHDRSRFEIHGFCTSIDDTSDARRRIVAACDRFTIVGDATDEVAARAIRNDEIDILIHLNSLNRSNRLGIARWRAAPIQAAWFGFIGPVPMPELDFLMCDEFVVPPAYALSNAPADAARPMSRADAGLPEGRFVFCCFSPHEKITEQLFGAWMDILRRTAPSVLWLAADNNWSRDNLRMRAIIAGIDPARLVFTAPTAEIVPSHAVLADLFLDTFPYNAGPIALDAIQLGLPLITLSGESLTSRTTAGLLRAIDAASGIAETLYDYTELAVTLGNQPELHGRYRSLFSPNNRTMQAGAIASFTYHYEESLIQIELANRSGAAPGGEGEGEGEAIPPQAAAA